jgi:hypothetical protein
MITTLYILNLYHKTIFSNLLNAPVPAKALRHNGQDGLTVFHLYMHYL